LSQYLHELVTFPNGKHDDQADSTSQALDWLKNFMWEPAILVHYREKALERYRNSSNVDIPKSRNTEGLFGFEARLTSIAAELASGSFCLTHVFRRSAIPP
jgi:hypothetical protein